MDAIYDKSGSVVSWIGTGDNIFSLKGKPIAFIKEKNVWRFLDGHHLGTFKDGVFRDHNGSVVAFTDKAQNAGVFLPFNDNGQVNVRKLAEGSGVSGDRYFNCTYNNGVWALA